MSPLLKLFKSKKDSTPPKQKNTEIEPSNPRKSWPDFCQDNEVEASEIVTEEATTEKRSDSHDSQVEEPRVEEISLVGNSRWRNKDLAKRNGPGTKYKGGLGMADGMGRGY